MSKQLTRRGVLKSGAVVGAGPLRVAGVDGLAPLPGRPTNPGTAGTRTGAGRLHPTTTRFEPTAAGNKSAAAGHSDRRHAEHAGRRGRRSTA